MCIVLGLHSHRGSVKTIAFFDYNRLATVCKSLKTNYLGAFVFFDYNRLATVCKSLKTNYLGAFVFWVFYYSFLRAFAFYTRPIYPKG